jgi:L-glutamine-phosphate cytidylyltransferase
VKGIVLAAGRGSRLGALTDDRPKCLAPLAGKPLLAWQLDALASAGVDELGVVAGYRSELLAGENWTTFVAPRWEETNMVCSLCAASDWLRAEPCVVAYGDIVFTAATVERLLAEPADVAITYDPAWRELWSLRFADPLEDAESFRLAEDGSVVEIGRRPEAATAVEGQYMGLLEFTPRGWAAAESLLETLPPERRDRLHMTGLLQALVERGHRVAAVPCAGGWGEVDSESDLVLYEALVEMGRLELG